MNIYTFWGRERSIEKPSDAHCLQFAVDESFYFLEKIVCFHRKKTRIRRKAKQSRQEVHKFATRIHFWAFA